MKALFNCRATTFSLPMIWQGSPYLIPICNKALLEYWLDLCVWLGVREVLIVQYPGSGELESHLRGGSEWGLKIQYAHGDPDDVLPDMLLRNSAFLDQDTLILDGLQFPFYDRKALKPMPVQGEEPVIYCLDRGQLRLNDSCLLFPKPALDALLKARSERERFERWTSLPLDQHPALSFEVLIPHQLRDYYIICLRVLEAHGQFHLKGFEVAPGIFEGINNEIAERPTLGGPLITGSTCRLGPQVRIERSVLHEQVWIEGETTLRNCLVWGPVYLADVTLENQILLQNTLVDPLTGYSRPLEMPWRLRTRLENHSERAALQAADARTATRLLLTRWPLFQLLRWSVPAQFQKYYLNANGETLIVPRFELPEDANALQRFFFAQGLHRVPLLLAVREQRLLLTGTHLLMAGPEQLRYMQQLPIYAPGAFSRTEDLEPGTLIHLMEELNYCSQVDGHVNEAIWQQALERDKERYKG